MLKIHTRQRSVDDCHVWGETARLESTAHNILAASKRACGAHSGFVAFGDPSGEEGELLVVDSGALHFALRRELRAEVYRTARPLTPAHTDDAAIATYDGASARLDLLLLPLTCQGQTVGVLGLASEAGTLTKTAAALATLPTDIQGLACSA